MSKEKDKRISDIVYALADYKQLVLAYKSNYMKLIKEAAFWKACALWLGISAIFISLFAFFLLSDTKKNLAESKSTVNSLNHKINDNSEKLDQAENVLDRIQKELKVSQEELNKKEILIKKLKYNISSTSKTLLEKLLKEQEVNK